MGKFKINDKVRIKSNGIIGTIKGREIHPIPNTNRFNIEYVVKTGEGFNKWHSFTKNEIEKVPIIKEEKPIQTLVLEANNGYRVTLVAITQKEDIWNPLTYFRRGKRLSIGYAIYNPSDVYDLAIGIKIATHRAKTRPFCELLSQFSGEFNKETIDALLKVKGDYIVNNIDKFINKV